jgi:hypothetical protein
MNDVTPYSSVIYLLSSHPNFVQLSRFASSPTIHAAVFNDGVQINFLRRLPERAELDLIPFEHFLELYCHSPIVTVYIYGFCVCTSITFRFRNAHLPAEHGV